MQAKGPCQYFILGCCKHEKDADCNFSHDRELCKPGSIKIPCKHFVQGNYCRNGQHCLFLHDSSDRTRHEEFTKLKQTSLPKTREKVSKPLSEIKTVSDAETGSKLTWLKKGKEDKRGNELDDQNRFHADGDYGAETQVTQAEYNAQLANEETIYSYGTPGVFDGKDQNRTKNNMQQEQSKQMWKSYADIERTITPRSVDDFSVNVEDSSFSNTYKPLCRFFQQGSCRYGAGCRFSHIVSSTTASDEEATKLEILTSQKLECGICLEVITEKGDRRFGLLSSCEHAYCLSCIRNWRGQSLSDAQKESGMVQTCPLCRTVSYFIIPCDRMVTDPNRKVALIDEYKKGMGRIECRHYQRGKGECPFGDSCFYAHLNPDGTPAERNWNPRLLKTDDGATRVQSKPSLFDFVKNK